MLGISVSTPSIIVVDNFYADPAAVREDALRREFAAYNRFYKGKRSATRWLTDEHKREFERLLQRRITAWESYSANGCFQITNYDDPLVYHCDDQACAAAIYLTPTAPVGAGTSFWRDKKYHYRRAIDYDPEAAREVWHEYNLLHPDNWELVDRVGAVFNRLVLWDAKMIHSASSYESFGDQADKSRLVQLFFFDIA